MARNLAHGSSAGAWDSGPRQARCGPNGAARCPWRTFLCPSGGPGKWQPTPVFLPGESQGPGAWWAAVYGVAPVRGLEGLASGSDGKESDCNAGDLASIPGTRRSLGEGSGLPPFRLPSRCSGLLQPDVCLPPLLLYAGGRGVPTLKGPQPFSMLLPKHWLGTKVGRPSWTPF